MQYWTATGPKGKPIFQCLYVHHVLYHAKVLLKIIFRGKFSTQSAATPVRLTVEQWHNTAAVLPNKPMQRLEKIAYPLLVGVKFIYQNVHSPSHQTVSRLSCTSQRQKGEMQRAFPCLPTQPFTITPAQQWMGDAAVMTLSNCSPHAHTHTHACTHCSKRARYKHSVRKEASRARQQQHCLIGGAEVAFGLPPVGGEESLRRKKWRTNVSHMVSRLWEVQTAGERRTFCCRHADQIPVDSSGRPLGMWANSTVMRRLGLRGSVPI